MEIKGGSNNAKTKAALHQPLHFCSSVLTLKAKKVLYGIRSTQKSIASRSNPLILNAPIHSTFATYLLKQKICYSIVSVRREAVVALLFGSLQCQQLRLRLPISLARHVCKLTIRAF